ncbi:NUDIX hydrolase [Sulfitobacter sp. F26204]|uniref:NUDIX domain-containing protein n=1 Tax=Sulfitobacter sp. F26204 TaxID=2996014 RepID=UPI00225DDE4D|nr:NUDIX hydrolase [Sulfitobacter sp. F26204]MCX7558860.1 NUDIX hydrolase [Sulfitobacter sp. F26204]
MRPNSPRLAVRGLILHEARLLMVNAYPNGQSDLLCAPGGGVEPGSSLPDNLCREVFEETGLHVTVGDPCLVNEFHDPASRFHQVDVYFRCTLKGTASIDPNWRDVERIVNEWHWLTQAELATRRYKPDSLLQVAFGDPGLSYDPLEPLVR